MRRCRKVLRTLYICVCNSEYRKIRGKKDGEMERYIKEINKRFPEERIFTENIIYFKNCLLVFVILNSIYQQLIYIIYVYSCTVRHKYFHTFTSNSNKFISALSADLQKVDLKIRGLWILYINSWYILLRWKFYYQTEYYSTKNPRRGFLFFVNEKYCIFV